MRTTTSRSSPSHRRNRFSETGDLDLLVSIEAPPDDFDAFAAEVDAVPETLSIAG